jgi:hypothetical protein
MFFRKKKPANRIAPWTLLRWWRQADDFVAWVNIDPRKPLQPFAVDDRKVVLVEFDKEVSILTSEYELGVVLDELLKKAQQQLREEKERLEAKAMTQSAGQLVLKTASIGKDTYLVKPFIQSTRSLLAFGPLKAIELSLSATFQFQNRPEAEKELAQRITQWTKELQADRIDSFVSQQSLRLFQEFLHHQAEKVQFDALKNILSDFDAIILQQDTQVSEDYLKKVWQIPLFLYANQPEQAVFTRLLIQKSFQSQREELGVRFRQMYMARLLQRMLFREFDETEQSELSSLLKSDRANREFITSKLFDFYKQLLMRCGIPIEIGELYGTEVYVKRVAEIFAQFPTGDNWEVELQPGALYAILLEESVVFAMRNHQVMTATPKELLRAMIRVIIRRLSAFQQQKKKER